MTRRMVAARLLLADNGKAIIEVIDNGVTKRYEMKAFIRCDVTPKSVKDDCNAKEVLQFVADEHTMFAMKMFDDVCAVTTERFSVHTTKPNQYGAYCQSPGAEICIGRLWVKIKPEEMDGSEDIDKGMSLVEAYNHRSASVRDAISRWAKNPGKLLC